MAVRSLQSHVGVETSDQVVAFTFDDGPHLTRTPRVLDLLADSGATATFFLLGERVRALPDTARLIVDAGHEVAVHGDVHSPLDELALPPQLRALARARRSVRAATGQRPRWFRPPYGKQSKRTVVAARMLGMHPVMWTAHAEEWTDQSLSRCIDSAAHGIRPGGVVLLHDGVGDGSKPPGRDDDALAEVVAGLLHLATERDLAVVSFSDLASRGPSIRRAWFGEWNL